MANIFFGDVQRFVFNKHDAEQMHAVAQDFVEHHQLTGLTVLDQVHGTEIFVAGQLFSSGDTSSIVERQGDALITYVPRLAIGVMTADCVPMVLYDQKNSLCAVVHAGWRGTYARIADIVVEKICSLGADRSSLQVYFGPSIGQCCYSVQADVAEKFLDSEFAHMSIKPYADRWALDLQAFNTAVLTTIGIPFKNIHSEYVACTSCDKRYASYRRMSGTSLRQLTAVWL